MHVIVSNVLPAVDVSAQEFRDRGRSLDRPGATRPTSISASRTGTVVAMSTQIAVRLPDDLVAYVDGAVASGRVKSRAEFVARLLARDARRQRAEDDLRRLLESGDLDGHDALQIARATADTPLPFD